MARGRRVGRAARVDKDSPCAISALPPVLLARVWALLPLHTRLACVCVCRAWRSGAADASAWENLSLDGVPRELATDRLLVAAATHAAGQLRSLDLGGWPWLLNSLFAERSFFPFVATHGGATLRDLRTPRLLEAQDLAELMALAPALRALRTDVTCSVANARRMLRGEPPFGPALQLRSLHVCRPRDVKPDGLLADLVACQPLRRPSQVVFESTDCGEPAALEALVDAVLATRLTSLGLSNMHLPPPEAAIPALTRLLSAPECALTHLTLRDLPHLLNGPEDVQLLAAALHGAATLTTLVLRGMLLWDTDLNGDVDDYVAGASLIGSLATHPTLRTLRVHDVPPSGEASFCAGAEFRALITARTSSLLTLDLTGSNLGHEGLAALFDALPYAPRLRALVLGDDTVNVDEEFEEVVMLPAVQANRSLWRLLVRRKSKGVARAMTMMVKARRIAAGVTSLADEGVDVKDPLLVLYSESDTTYSEQQGAADDDDEVSSEDDESDNGRDQEPFVLERRDILEEYPPVLEVGLVPGSENGPGYPIVAFDWPFPLQ